VSRKDGSAGFVCGSALGSAKFAVEWYVGFREVHGGLVPNHLHRFMADVAPYAFRYEWATKLTCHAPKSGGDIREDRLRPCECKMNSA
jgi:hypothetical protein